VKNLAVAPSFCRSCGASITWYKTVTGKNIPVQPAVEDGVNKGNIKVVNGRAYMCMKGEVGPLESHFAKCPNANRHRKKQPTKTEQRAEQEHEAYQRALRGEV
jgi:hypothetical protein